MDEDLKLLLQKVASFINISNKERKEAKQKVASLQIQNNKLQNQVNLLKKQSTQLSKISAEQLHKKQIFDKSIVKAAQALYEADFIIDEFEKKEFLKLAGEDPKILADWLVKVCKAADVSLIGIPARIAAKQHTKEADYDPVMARAFGYDKGYYNTLED